jgi:hypothetical protein
MNQTEVQTVEDADHDLWHRGSDNLWRNTGVSESEPGLTFEELDETWGDLWPVS